MNKKLKNKLLTKILDKPSILCLTEYTVPIAKLVDKYADIILVGDSVGPVIYGLKSTRDVTLEMMIGHASRQICRQLVWLLYIDAHIISLFASRRASAGGKNKLIHDA